MRTLSRCRWAWLALALTAWILPLAALGQQPRVELELVMEPDFPTEQARQWSATLSKAGIDNVRIRAAAPGDRVRVERTGTARAPSYKVTGLLTRDQKLVLPGGKFAASDAAGIAAWLGRLQESGPEELSARPGAFGLLPSQLVATHESLSGKVDFSTKGKPPQEVVAKIAAALKLKVRLDGAAQQALAECDPVGDELLGLTHGTALAAAIRPAGLVLVPAKSGAAVELAIVDSRSAKESWPIGWPIKEAPRDVLPELFKMIPAEVHDTPLGETLEAIRGRVKAPMVVDYNALARLRVDLETTKVNLPKSNTYYAKVLDRILFPIHLKYELRVDEADQPFLWITSVRPK